MASKLQLSSRIAARNSVESLAGEIGRDAASAFQQRLNLQMARGLAILDLERRCASAAADAGVDMALLKFAALHRLGCVSVATRPAVDLDLLVDESCLGRLCEVFKHMGVLRMNKWVPSHHPAVLRAANGRSVELHICLPYVRLKSKGPFATLSALKEEGLLERLSAEPGRVLLPSRDLLVAHLVAHGLVSHVYAPAAYPPLRLLSDAVDLGLRRDSSVVKDAARWVASDVPEGEVQALADLAGACACGDVETVLKTESRASFLLRHMLASVMDAGYRRRMRLFRVQQIIEEVGPVEMVRHMGRAAKRELLGFIRRTT